MKKRRILRLGYLAAAACTLAFLLLFALVDQTTTSSGYCLSCHEMNAGVGEGWRGSAHYSNTLGMVAECSDCHVNTGIEGFFASKLWPALRDHYVHFFGNSDPATMDWEALRTRVRQSVSNEACKRCHEGLTEPGLSKAAIAAHTWADENPGGDYPNCLACHVEPMHPVAATGQRGWGPDRVYSHAEILARGGEKAAWIVVDGGIYDVTEFRRFHSGGEWCFDAGLDNTKTCRTCHEPPNGPGSEEAQIDSWGVPIKYALKAYDLPIARIGTLVSVGDPASPYYVPRVDLIRMKPRKNDYGVVDDLGITRNYEIGPQGALKNR